VVTLTACLLFLSGIGDLDELAKRNDILWTCDAATGRHTVRRHSAISLIRTPSSTLKERSSFTPLSSRETFTCPSWLTADARKVHFAFGFTFVSSVSTFWTRPSGEKEPRTRVVSVFPSPKSLRTSVSNEYIPADSVILKRIQPIFLPLDSRTEYHRSPTRAGSTLAPRRSAIVRVSASFSSADRGIGMISNVEREDSTSGRSFSA